MKKVIRLNESDINRMVMESLDEYYKSNIFTRFNNGLKTAIKNRKNPNMKRYKNGNFIDNFKRGWDDDKDISTLNDQNASEFNKRKAFVRHYNFDSDLRGSDNYIDDVTGGNGILPGGNLDYLNNGYRYYKKK